MTTDVVWDYDEARVLDGRGSVAGVALVTGTRGGGVQFELSVGGQSLSRLTPEAVRTLHQLTAACLERAETAAEPIFGEIG